MIDVKIKLFGQIQMNFSLQYLIGKYAIFVSFLPSCQIFSSHVGTHAPILFCQSKSGANIAEKWLKNRGKKEKLANMEETKP